MDNKPTVRQQLKAAILVLCVMIIVSFSVCWGFFAVIAYLFGYTISFLQALGLWVAWILIKIQLKKYRRG